MDTFSIKRRTVKDEPVIESFDNNKSEKEPTPGVSVVKVVHEGVELTGTVRKYQNS